MGRNGGGIISEVTKSGSNTWHGSAYDYLRNGDLDANSYFRNLNGISRDPLRRNQYGGSLGGPILIPDLINGKVPLFLFCGFTRGKKQSDQPTPVLSQVPVFTSRGDRMYCRASAGLRFFVGPQCCVIFPLASNRVFSGSRPKLSLAFSKLRRLSTLCLLITSLRDWSLFHPQASLRRSAPLPIIKMS